MAATDIFFVIESVNVFMEKLLELFDEPVLAYAKTEWLKYKEILTSSEFSPLKCFSYSNAVTITKPFNPIQVAPTNVPIANLQLQELDTSIQRSKNDSRDEKQDSIHLGPWSLANIGSGQNLPSTMNKSKEQGSSNINNISSSSNNFDYSQQYFQPSQSIPMQSSNTQLQSHILNGSQSSQPSNSQPSIPQLQFTASNIVFNVKQENNLHNHNYNNNNISINNSHTTNIHSNNNTPLGYQITPTYQHFTPGAMTPQSKDTQKILQNLTSGSISSASSFKPTIEKERMKSPSMVQITPNTSMQKLQPSKSISIVNTGTPATPGNKATFVKLKTTSPPSSSLKKLVPAALGRSPAGTNAATAHMKAQKSLQIDIKENTLSQRITSIPGTNHHSSRSSSASSRIPNPTSGATFYNSIGAHKPAQQSVTENISNPNVTQGNINTKNQNINGQPVSTFPQGVRNSISNLAISANSNINSVNQTQRITAGGQLGLKSIKSLNQTPLLASMNIGRSQQVPPLLVTPSMTMFNPSGFGTQSAALSQRSQTGGASVITESINIDNLIKSQNQGSYANGAGSTNFSAYPQNSIYNSSNNRLINIKTEKSTIIENSPNNSQKNSKIGQDLNKINIEKNNSNNQVLESTTNLPQSSGGTANRRKTRRETRKLSLEKYQLNIDAINKQNEQENDQSDDLNQDSPSNVPKNKGFLQVMLNRFEAGINPNSQEKKRETSPVNKRVCSEKIQDFSAFNEISSVTKKVENPFKNLIASMKQRLSHFKMDTLTLQLVVGKQKNVDETPTNRNTEPEVISFENTVEAPQERTQVKRGNLKRFSVFAKKDNVNQNSKKVDEQITQAQQQSQLMQIEKKPNGNKKNRDDKKKIIF